MSIVEEWWRGPGAKLGTSMLIAMLVFGIPVWATFVSYMLVGQSFGVLGFLGAALGTPLTLLVLLAGVVGWLVKIPDHHKAVMAGVVVITVISRVTFLMFF